MCYNEHVHKYFENVDCSFKMQNCKAAFLRICCPLLLTLHGEDNAEGLVASVCGGRACTGFKLSLVKSPFTFFVLPPLRKQGCQFGVLSIGEGFKSQTMGCIHPTRAFLSSRQTKLNVM